MMCCVSCNSYKQTGKYSIMRKMALLICVCFIIVSFLSAAFIITHANHEHDHEGPNGSCAICIRLAVTENLLKQLSVAIVAAGLVFAFSSFAPSDIRPFALYAFSFTPVALKVRLDN